MIQDYPVQIWEEAPGDWRLNYFGTEYEFNSEKEIVSFMAKVDTAKAIIRTVQSLAMATDAAENLVAEYWDAAGEGWVDVDVVTLGITAAQLTACITLLEQIDLLMTNQATTPSMYRGTLNHARRINV